MLSKIIAQVGNWAPGPALRGLDSEYALSPQQPFSLLKKIYDLSCLLIIPSFFPSFPPFLQVLMTFYFQDGNRFLFCLLLIKVVCSPSENIFRKYTKMFKNKEQPSPQNLGLSTVNILSFTIKNHGKH